MSRDCRTPKLVFRPTATDWRFIYSHCVNAETPSSRCFGQPFPWCAFWAAELKGLFAGYVDAKQAQNILYYDDLMLYRAQMASDRALADDISNRFDHVMVDTNRLQFSILLALKPDGRSLTVVGDDAQSIYSFRAATVRNILKFPDHFALHAEVVTLEQNYRSTEPIPSQQTASSVLPKSASPRTSGLTGRPPESCSLRWFVTTRRARSRSACSPVGKKVPAEIASGSVPNLIAQCAARNRIDRTKYSVCEVRRTRIPRCGSYQGHAGPFATSSESARIRAIGSPAFAFCICLRASGRLRQNACSIMRSRHRIQLQCWSAAVRRRM